MNFLQISFSTIFALTLFFSCSNDDGNNSSDDEMQMEDPVTSFKCKLDGEDFEPAGLFILGSSSLNNEVQTLTASGTILSGGQTTIITINLITSDFENLKAGDQFDGSVINLEAYAFGVIGIDNGSGNNSGGTSENTLMADLTITAIDRDAETFSGTFSFTAEDEDANQTFIVTEGVFEHVEYD